MNKSNLTSKTDDLAIVGMGIHWGPGTNLDSFERHIYEGNGGDHQIQPSELAEKGQLDPAQQWMLTAANEALQDADVNRGGAIAVIITSTSQTQVSHSETADLIRSLWRFSGGFSTLEAQETSTFAALELSQRLLAAREVDTVLVGVLGRSGSSAIVLKRLETATAAGERIYALINAIHPSPPPPETIHYLELCGGALATADLSIYQGSALSCALGTLSPTLPPTSDLTHLIKVALCLYYRYLPAVPQGAGPQQDWQHSPFYVPTESRPWLLDANASLRNAAVYQSQSGGHILLSECPAGRSLNNRYLAQMPLCCFALAAPDPSTLLEKLHALQDQIVDSASLKAVAHETWRAFHQATYVLVLLAKSKAELDREIQRALTGIPQAIATTEDWQTPAGSYFTPRPLAQTGRIAFVYPGAFGAYVGLARTLFRLFPSLYDDPLLQEVSQRAAKVEKILYPRSLKPLSRRQREAIEQRLLSDPFAMLESELAYASLATATLRDYFQLQPHCAFGYSLGETSMMFAQGVWTSLNEGSAAFNASTLFRNRLSGPKNAVREHWGLADADELSWSTYVVMAPAPQVKECLEAEPRVYLTQINTPQEGVIAGETAACERVIKALNCNAFRAPFNHAIHCAPVRSEYSELVRLNRFPVEQTPHLTLYSAAGYQPIETESEVIGQSIAQNLCQSLDFPRLVNRVYEDGVRIFVETGAGSTTTRWIDQILAQRPHLALSFNRRGLDEHTTIVRALAKLLSHGVSVDVSPLFETHAMTPPPAEPAEIRARLSEKLQAARLQTLHSQIFQGLRFGAVPPRSQGFQSRSSHFSSAIAVKSHANVTPARSINLSPCPAQSPQPSLSRQSKSYGMLHQNNLQMARVHRDFLRWRQDSLQQMQEMLQLQLQVSQTLLQRSKD
ncbi:PfaB family protein [Acaryochloris sp. IP29b_bin.148]|uniref:PfaB family protein n=1 Tax=Acaryochloris sp. IP29b_bin.148 TaxID=2969218 RepID=UPI00261AA6A1|nr:PfaB family protein [Acaryochloris sp. IP29b_bin.148]